MWTCRPIRGEEIANDQSVDDNSDSMVFLGIEGDFLIDRHNRPINAQADEPFATYGFEKPCVLSFALGNDGGEEGDFLSLGHTRNRLRDFTRGLFLECLQTDAAVHLSDFCPEEPHVIVDFRHGAHSRARVPR